MDKFVGKVALVTGASLGIGKSICEKLVQHGMVVVGCARSKDKLDSLAASLNQSGPGKMHAVQCDLTKEDELLNVFKFIKDNFGTMHVCVNNAGLAYEDTTLLSGSTELWRNMLDVNILALSICTRESYQLMKDGQVDDGHFININSMSGHRIVGLPFYSATKFAVTALTEGLRRELRAAGTNIRTTSISPGLVETSFHTNMFNDEEKATKLYNQTPVLFADDIANGVLYALSQPQHVDVNDVFLRPTKQAM